MLAFLIAHVSLCVLRYREADSPRPYCIPLSIRLGGIGGPLDNFVGDATKYVVRKAPCRVLLTAPAGPTDGSERPQPNH